MIKSLRSKFILIIFALIVAFMGQVIHSSLIQKRLIENQQDLSSSYDNVGLVHEIERNLVDLQRHLLVYKETGSDNSIARFNEIMADAQMKLATFETNNAQVSGISVDANILSRMHNHLQDYQENFNSVLKTRTLQNSLYTQKILPTFNTIRSQLETFGSQQEQTELNYILALAEKTLSQYIIYPDYEFVIKFKDTLDLITEIVGRNKALAQHTEQAFTELQKTVGKLTSITRSYVFLVNVVMAGSANEFLILTKTLRESVIEQQTALNQKTSIFAKESQIKNTASSVLAIGMLLFISIFLTRKILNPIKTLTDVFSKLAKSEQITEIPETQRQDEIGDLAKAANVFQEKNLQTTELLENARELNSQQEELNVQLEIEKSRAEAAAESKAMFLANMSHEIRTPMNGIVGLIELLRKTELTDKQKQYLKKAAFSGQIMMNVINDILDFSKIEAGKLNIEMIEFDLDELIENIITSLNARIDNSKIDFRVNYSPTLPSRLRGDPLRISQIILNLCSNAIKFTKQGSIFLDFDYQSINATNKLIIKVRDTGIGMSKKQLESIFESFTQADGSTSRQFGGTGLGLSIVKQLCSMMLGEITVESTLNRGSEFTVSLTLSATSDSLLLNHQSDLLNTHMLYVCHDKNPLVDKNLLKLISSDYTLINWDELRKIPSLVGKNQRLMIDILSTELLDKYQDEIIELQTQISDIYFLTDYKNKHLKSRIHTLFKASVLSHPFSPRQFRHFFRDNPAYADPAPSEKQLIPENTKLSGHLLIVEDNTINQLVVSHMVANFGLSYEIANNGLEAVNLIKENHNFSLVLMDIQMPVMDGYEATTELRKAGYEDLVICGLSANAMSKDLKKADEIGMNDYLTKPIDIDMLEKVLRKYLQPVTG